MAKITAQITGVGGFVPDYVLTNTELERMVETNDEWITSRTGIKERRILKGEGKGVSDLAIPCVIQLLEKTNTDPAEVDLVIFANTTPDHLVPSSAPKVASSAGIKNAWAFDINAACCGFLFALTTGAQYIESGRYKKVIVIGADKMSSIIDYTDRATCIIFGDGGGAVMLEPTDDGHGVVDFIHKCDGVGENYLNIWAGGSRFPASHESIDARKHFVFQDGKTVFKHAVTNMARVSHEVMARNGLTGNDIAWLVPHQANRRIIEATANAMDLPFEKSMLNIERYGNTTSGTIPLCLWDYEPQLKRGDNLILAAFGAGFTWGAIYLKWAYDPK